MTDRLVELRKGDLIGIGSKANHDNKCTFEIVYIATVSIQLLNMKVHLD